VDRTSLLERGHELAVLDEAIEGLGRGEGGTVVFEGIAGIGKTALLEQARGRAQDAGFGVLTASGGELERDFPYGLVRQLFESVVHRLGPEARAEVLAGAAGLAAAVVEPGAARAGADAFAVQHGLYWLTANLAERAPVVIVADDLHWADVPSLRFLLFLSRRLESVPALLVLAVRTGEPGADSPPLAQLAAAPLTSVVRPAALSDAAVAGLVDSGLGHPDAQFVAACRAATGGTPFLVRELVDALAADGVAPTAGSARRVLQFGPQTVAHATLMRLARLSGGALPVTKAVAVLGAAARADLVARLAELGDDEALAAVDALVAAHVLRPGHPLDFVHPIVRAAVYAQLPPGERSAAHARAAELLEEDCADADAVATHVRLTLPAARPEAVARLREAARRALQRGAPEAAAGYLQRALEEGGDPRLRNELLLELARAEAILRAPSAVEHLQEALASAADPGTRGRILADLAEIFFLAGQWHPAVAAIDSALAQLDDSDGPLALRLRAMWTGASTYDPELMPRLESELPELLEQAQRGGAAARSLNLMLAGRAAVRGNDVGGVPALVERGLDAGRFVTDHGSENAVVPQAMCALAFVDRLDEVAAVSDELLRDARARGSVVGFASGAAHHALAHSRRGDLADAEADLRAALAVLQEHELMFALPVTLWYASDAILERPSLDDVAALAQGLQLPPGIDTTVTGAWLLELRGRLRLQSRDIAGAVEDLRGAGRTMAALGHRNPTYSPWRSVLALALAGDAPEEALELAREQLADARRIGLARGLGVALGTVGLLEGDQDALREAVAVLEPSPARLEHARALVELGAALRRGNQRAAAREALRAGLDVATRCGADRLAQRARDELAASGARASRQPLRGAAALTPSERRVAVMAAAGMSSPEIAQALFITVNTIETHLRHVYAKLGINRRAQVAEAMSSG
jgi:DNA-binding CsgD family transcriptional regulator